MLLMVSVEQLAHQPAVLSFHLETHWSDFTVAILVGRDATTLPIWQ